MRYIVVKQKLMFDLIAEVNNLIQQGWVPLGGVSATEINYLQAMTKTD